MSVNVEKFAKSLIDMAAKLGVKLTLGSANIAKWATENPALAATIAQIVTKGVTAIKSVNTAELLKLIGELRSSGFSYKEIFSGAAKGAVEAGGGKAGLAIGAAKLAAIAAAAAFAKATVKQATKAWNVKTEKIKTEGANAKNLWELAWETSIPVATYRQLEAFGKSVGNFFTGKKDNKSNESSKKEQSFRDQAMDKLGVTDTGEANKISVYTGYNYDEEAAKLGLGARPNNPTAENQWKKEVEKQMKKTSKTQNTKLNSPDWYFQGDAKKFLGTTLTWTGIKDHTAAYPFVAACGLKVSLLIPTDRDRKLHHQIISNTNVMWQALRGKNTGAFNYTEEDVYTYQMALSALIAVYRFTGKLISLANKRDPEIEQLPIMLLAGHYVSRLGTNTGKTNYYDIINNRSNYITALNSLGKDINTYALKGTTLISRWNYLADKCIKDYNGPKCVYGFYSLEGVPSLSASGITYGGVGGLTIPQLLAYIQGQLDLIRTYSNGVLLKVAGDMIKLLGSGTTTFNNVPYFTGAEVPVFEYDPEAFDQIRNAKMIPTSYTTAPSYDRNTASRLAVDIQAPTGNPTLPKTDCMLLDTNYMVTSDRKVEYSPQENIQLLQFFFNAEDSGESVANGFRLLITDCGTSKLDYMSVVLYDGTTGDPVTQTFCSLISVYNGSNNNAISIGGVTDTLHGTAAARYTDMWSIIEQIDFMPRLQQAITSTSVSSFFSKAYDVDNYAYVTADQYTQLNNVAVYSQTFTFKPEDVKIMGILGL